MSIIKGKEVLNKSEVKEKIGYLSVNLSPEQWGLVKKKQLKIEEIYSNQEKIYKDRKGQTRLDLRLSKNNETVNIKVVGEDNINEILDLFEEVTTLYTRVKYEEVYMKGRTLLELELIDNVTDKEEEEEDNPFN